MPELKTRIQLKYDSYENWMKDSFILKNGEVAIVTIETVDPAQKHLQPVMFKVGDGTKAFSQLDWVSAKAADVYSWAKKSDAEFTEWVKTLITVDDIDLTNYYTKTEVDDLLDDNSEINQKYADDAIKAAIEALDVTDAAVAGKYVSAVSEVDGKIAVSREDLPVYTLTPGTANGTVAFNGTDVAVTGLGSAAYVETTAFDAAGSAKAVSDALDSYKTTNNAAVEAAAAKGQKGIDDAAAALAKANEKTTMAEVEAKDYATKAEAQAMADGKDAAIKAAKDAADAAQQTIDDFLIGENVNDAVDTLKEIQDELKTLGEAVELTEAFAAKADKTTTISAGTGLTGGGDLSDNRTISLSDETIASLALADSAVQPDDLNDYYTKTEADAEFMDSDEVDAKIAAAFQGDNSIKVDEAAHADTATKADKATHATNADNATNAQEAAHATNADKAADADKLGGTVAADYLKKAEAPGYADILTKTDAAATYQPKGDYASKEQGEKADSALQSIAAGTGLKVSAKTDNSQTVEIDESVVFVFDCGNATDKIYN